MRSIPVVSGGIVAGTLIVVGEAILNLLLLGDEWNALLLRFELSQPTTAIVLQGLLKLMILGVVSVWLAVGMRPALVRPERAGLVAGLVVWFLVWAWVQWGMLLVGYVTSTIAAVTVAWGVVELPLAVHAGIWMHDRFDSRAS